jgi:hypothetical protein
MFIYGYYILFKYNTMSVCLPNIEPPYEDENFDSSELDEMHCKCAICLCVIKIPYETGVCYHTFCKKCMMNGSYDKCPSCQIPFNKNAAKFSFLRYQALESLVYTCTRNNCNKQFKMGTNYRNITEHVNSHLHHINYGIIEYMPTINSYGDIVESVVWTLKISTFRNDLPKDNIFDGKTDVTVKSKQFILDDIPCVLYMFPNGISRNKEKNFPRGEADPKKTNGISLYIQPQVFTNEYIKKNNLKADSIFPKIFGFSIVDPCGKDILSHNPSEHIFTKAEPDRGYDELIKPNLVDKYINSDGEIKIQFVLSNIKVQAVKKDEKQISNKELAELKELEKEFNNPIKK